MWVGYGDHLGLSKEQRRSIRRFCRAINATLLEGVGLCPTCHEHFFRSWRSDGTMGGVYDFFVDPFRVRHDTLRGLWTVSCGSCGCCQVFTYEMLASFTLLEPQACGHCGQVHCDCQYIASWLDCSVVRVWVGSPIDP